MSMIFFEERIRQVALSRLGARASRYPTNKGISGISYPYVNFTGARFLDKTIRVGRA